jgi:hypothetical protein
VPLAFVLPLGIPSKGLRILVMGVVCVHVRPHTVDSVIHHRGGPLFFALSLVPLFLLLWWLRRQEKRAMTGRHVEAKASTFISNDVTL